MAVTLSLTKHPADVVLTCLSFSCGADGAVIGRGADASWVLVDPRRVLSARHCQISCVNGRYLLTDLSTNGTFLNDSKTALGRGTQVVLQHGDHIGLGDYRVRVAIAAEENALPNAPPATLAQPANRSLQSGTATALALPGAAAPSAAVKNASPEEAAAPASKPAEPAFYKKPSPKPNTIASETKGAQVAAHRAGYHANSDPIECESILRALGLQNAELSATERAQLPKMVGEMLRETLAGMMQVLHARASIKNEFRLCITTIQPVENNPIKFSASVDDAVQNLFVRRSPAFKAPVAAVKDGFDAIADHQIATMAGLRAAFKALLANFDPVVLEQNFRQGNKHRLELGKGKYWKAYQTHYRRLSDDMDNAFHDLFGDDFVLAYEDQLGKLAKARESANPKG